MIDPFKSKTPFASVNDVCSFGDAEDEVLFSMHTVFRIGDIKPTDENRRVFRVDLSLTTDDDRDLRLLTDYIREENFPDSPGWYRLAIVLHKIGHSQKAEQVFEVMLDQTAYDYEKPPIYHAIGCTKNEQGNYKEAITYYEKSVEIKRKTLPSNHPDTASSCNNIGNVYGNMGEYSKALSSYEKALAIQQQSLPFHHPDFVISYNNIGALYLNMRKYSKASLFFEHAVDNTQRSLPLTHPHLQAYRKNLEMVKKSL